MQVSLLSGYSYATPFYVHEDSHTFSVFRLLLWPNTFLSKEKPRMLFILCHISTDELFTSLWLFGQYFHVD